jgi:signal transduction histidine kinase
VRVLRALRSSAVWPELVEEWREIEKPAINTLAGDLIYTRVVEVTNARITPQWPTRPVRPYSRSRLMPSTADRQSPDDDHRRARRRCVKGVRADACREGRARPSSTPWLLLALIVFAALAPTSKAHAQNDHKQVLVLYSTRPDSQFALLGDSELARTLDAELAGNLDYNSEYIDLSRFSDPAYKEALREFLRLKYRGVRFDLIIAMREGAIEFVASERDSLFHDTPVVFLANDSASRVGPNSTGLIHNRDFGGTLALIRRLQPDVRQIFIVTGTAPVDRRYEAAVREQLPADSGLAFTYLAGLPTLELENRLAHLPERSAVYYVLVTEDGAGKKFHPLEYVDRVAAAANAPTYCWVDSAIDHGIVGGSVYRQRGAIDRVGEVALRVLRGDAPDAIPVTTIDLNVNQVDWRQLRRWRIGEARVPPGTVVLFRDPTLWDRYKVYIVTAVALLITQTALITGLLIQRTRRRRVEKELRRSRSELQKSYERNRNLGSRLLNVQETERSRIARELHDDICQRMLVLTVELESLNRASPKESPAAAALTRAQDIARSLHELSHQLHPTRLRMLGLVVALERLCDELSRRGLQISCTHTNVPAPLHPDVTLCLFRVVQEAVQNAVKHSNANEVAVHVTGGSGGLTVTIVDDGTGFDVAAAWEKGIGLASMVERVEAIGGTLNINSSPDASTRVTATVPAVPITTTPTTSHLDEDRGA